MRGFRKQAQHETLNMQRNAVLAEELADFNVGDRVMTVDGFPGKISAVDFGPYQNTENYQVVLDGGMGGGSYNPGQLKLITSRAAARIEAAEVYASIPVEAVTDHTANLDYPELENILTDRLPNENIRVFAVNNTKDDDTDDDESDKLDQVQENQEEPKDPNVDDSAAGVDPPDETDEDTPQTGPQIPNVTPPSSCSFCGNADFEDPQMTGRGTRMRCTQCGGTMKSWGGQWEPEFPNSPQNNASEQGDYRSGGAGGVVQAPGANYKDSSLHTNSGLINWVVDKIFDAIQEKQDEALRGGSKHWADFAVENGQAGSYGHDDQQATYLRTQSALDDREFGFHMTASWLDVQAKARKIRSEGHVKIVNATNLYCVGEVQGDTNVYETQLNYVVGSKKVADWACGCKWASYTWGRSKPFRRFEGRLCSHALALQYEAGARGMFGKEIQPDSEYPLWNQKGAPVVVQYDKASSSDLARFSSLVLDSDGVYPEPGLLDLAHMPVYAFAVNMLEHDEPITAVIQMFASFGVDREEARAMAHEAFAEPASEGPESHAKRAVAAGWYADTDNDLEFRTGSSSINEMAWAENAKDRDLSDHDNDDPTNPHKKHHHRTNDARENAPHNIHNQGLGLLGWLTCGQCNGSGCGHCAGQGVVSPEVAATSTQALTDQTPDQTSEAGGAISSDGVSSSLHESAYNVGSPFPEDGSSGYRSPTSHSFSENPASTGWATSQDPGDWGRSLISNNFGVTFDASLHTTAKASDPLEGPTVSGVALKANDTGRVLMIQRSMKDDKDPAKGTWEFPGGHHEEGDATSLHAGIREWQEEVGQPFPEGGHVTHVHRSGPYNLHTIVIPEEAAVDFSKGRSHDNPDDPDGDDHEQAAWWDPEHAKKNPALRSELKGAASWGDIKKAAHLGEHEDHRSLDTINEDDEEKITEPKQVMRASLSTDDVTQEDLDAVLGTYVEFKESTLHEEPEAALPVTDGGFANDPAGEDVQSTLAGNSVDGPHVGADDAASIREAFLKSSAAKAIADVPELQSKLAMKDFNHAEQQELINEGVGDRARNFGDLKIAGTHYEQLPDEEDDWFQ